MHQRLRSISATLKASSRLKLTILHLHPSRTMSTFKLPDSDINVTLTPDLTKDELLSFPAFKSWLSTLQHNLGLQNSHNHPFNASPYELKSLKIQSITRFGSKKIGFMNLSAEIRNGDGESLPGSILLRGPSVGMLIILVPEDAKDEDEKYTLLTIQPRVPAGTLRLAELPAGMVDGGTFAGSAAKEIKEELGLEIAESELINLTELAIPVEEGEKLPRAFFPSAGGSDEYVPIFLHKKIVKRKSLDEWTGKLTGEREKGEKITLKLVRLDELWKEGARDSKALAAWALYEGLRREGKLTDI